MQVGKLLTISSEPNHPTGMLADTFRAGDRASYSSARSTCAPARSAGCSSPAAKSAAGSAIRVSLAVTAGPIRLHAWSPTP